MSNPRNGVIQLKEGGTTKYSDFSLFKKVIVSKGAEETFLAFIVKIRIILFGCTSTIYSGTERRGNRLVARETERESVCVRLSFA